MKTFVLNKDVDRSNVIANLIRFLQALPPDKAWSVEVDRLKRERSDLQNRALWGCAYKELREQTGSDKDELHTVFCGDYYGWAEYEVMGQRKKRPRRTTTKDEHGNRDVISVLDFADFYAFVQQRAAEFGFYVPDPDPTWFMKKEAA